MSIIAARFYTLVSESLLPLKDKFQQVLVHPAQAPPEENAQVLAVLLRTKLIPQVEEYNAGLADEYICSTNLDDSAAREPKDTHADRAFSGHYHTAAADLSQAALHSLQVRF